MAGKEKGKIKYARVALLQFEKVRYSEGEKSR